MWHRLKNLILNLETYSILSPDLVARRQVNRAIGHRPALTEQQWFLEFCQPLGIAPSIATFAYTHLEQYSGIKFAHVTPGDRLVEDLHWIEVCWADWEIALCDDFWHSFGIDISDRLLDDSFSTVGELTMFLNHQFFSIPSSRDENVNSK